MNSIVSKFSGAPRFEDLDAQMRDHITGQPSQFDLPASDVS